MPRLSAGLLPFHLSEPGELTVLIVHPGGPFWSQRDLGAWSIAKGEYELGADPLAAAEREFKEELGLEPPAGERLSLGEVKQPGGKRVVAWAVRGDLDVHNTKSNSFQLEWPPGSGKVQSFPEVDRVGWFGVGDAKSRVLKAQVPFIDRLIELLQDQDP